MVGFLEVRLGFVVLRQLNVENTAGNVEVVRFGLKNQAFGDDVDANLKRFVIKTDGGEIDVQADVFRIEQEGLAKDSNGVGGIAAFFVGFGGQLKGSRIDILRIQERLQCREGVLRLVIQELDGSKDLAFAGNVGTEFDGFLQSGDGRIELLQTDETSGEGVQALDLAFDKRTSFFEMGDGGGAVSFSKFEHGQHGVSGGIVRAELKQVGKQRDGSRITGLIFDLGRAFEGSDIVGRKFQGVPERSEGILVIALTAIGDGL